MKVFYAILFWLCFFFTAAAQNILSGVVVDSLTREPIQFANVFFARTMVQAITDEKGEFQLKGFSPGKYDLVISFVGFTSHQQTVVFSENQVKTLRVRMRPALIQLNEVVVNSDFSTKPQDFRLFKNHFLGENDNSSACKILNEEDVVAYREEESLLIAFSHNPIEVKNEALGYRIFYTLEKFEVNLDSLTESYSGYPRFEELKPKNLRQEQQWQDARALAYQGSFLHLIRTIRQGKMNGPFLLYKCYKIPNPNRPPDSVILKEIDFWRKMYKMARAVTGERRLAQDSLEYYRNAYQQPAIIDSIGQQFTSPDQLLDEGRNHITYKDWIYVIYNGRREESQYTNRYKSDHGKEQHSKVLFRKDITIYDNGYYEPQEEVFIENYMLWTKRVSNLLPGEYIPLSEYKPPTKIKPIDK
jgi:CarboxypepD_reg-like domain